VGELVHVLIIVAGAIVGVGAVCVGGLLAWRWRRPQQDAARTAPPAFASAKVVRAARRPRESGRRSSYPRHPRVNVPAAFTCTFMASAPRTSPPSLSATATTGKPAAPPTRPITTADGGEPVTRRGAASRALQATRRGQQPRGQPPRSARSRPQAVPSETDGNPHCVTRRVISSSRPCARHVWPGQET